MQRKEIHIDLNCKLPLKPHAKRTTPVSYSRLPVFRTARDIYEERQPKNNDNASYQIPLHRSNAILFDHPVDLALKKNNDNFASVCKKVPLPKPMKKRTLDDFLADQETTPIEGSSKKHAYALYMQYKLSQKRYRVADLRNRLRAVGITNLQLAEELTVAQVDIAALRGANQSLAQHNVHLQDQLKRVLNSKMELWKELAGIPEESFDDRDSDDDVPDLVAEMDPPPTLEEFYLETPTAATAPEVPAAPKKDLISNSAIDSTPMNGVKLEDAQPPPIPQPKDVTHHYLI